jgi:hypothetical protein
MQASLYEVLKKNLVWIYTDIKIKDYMKNTNIMT